MEIKFVKVFSNDVRLDSASLDTLKACPRVKYTQREGNSPAIVEGTWRGKAVTLRGYMTTGTRSNNTVCGYEPTEEEPFEITLFDGYKFKWASGTVMSFPYLVVEK
jgi:hypothetical protein